MEEEENQELIEDKPPETTDVDLENGIFNMVITLVQYYLGQGWTKQQACERVAGYLLSIVSGLQQQ